MIDLKKYDDLIQIHEPLIKKDGKKFKRQICSLGYLDAIYDEKEYAKYIPDDEECISLYADGYREGKIDKKNDRVKTALTKSIWICKLARFDHINNFNDRELSEKAQVLYNIELSDLSEFGIDEELTEEAITDTYKEIEKKVH